MRNYIESQHQGEAIIQLGALLGYNSSNIRGYCFGFILQWLCACLVMEEDIFDHRIQMIMDDATFNSNKSKLIEQIKNARKKVMSGERPSEEDKKYFEILEFYEGMLLFHSPLKYSEIFAKTLFQRNFEEISLIAGSGKIQALGGVTTMYSDVGIYTEEGIETHLLALETRINNTNYDAVEPIGFLLLNKNHAIGLTYHKKDNQWYFKDIALTPPSFSKTKLSLKEISAQIFNIFSPFPSKTYVEQILDYLYEEANRFRNGRATVSIGEYSKKSLLVNYQKNNAQWHVGEKPIKKEDIFQELNQFFNEGKLPIPYVGFITEIITTKDMQVKFQLEAQIASVKKPLKITDEIVQIVEQGDFVRIFAHGNRDDLIVQLIEHGINIYHGKPLMTDIAAQYGLVNVFEALKAKQMNFDMTSKDSHLSIGHSALEVAVESNQVNAVNWLLSQNLEVNSLLTNGNSPLFNAVFHGHMRIIEALVAHGAKINLPNREGVFPIHAAALNLHTQVIDKLLSLGADVNSQDSDGHTPVHYSVLAGIPQAVRVFSERNANLDIPNAKGCTPAWFAASRGKLDVLKELFKYHANMELRNTQGSTPIFMAAQEGKKDVVEFLLENTESVTIPFFATAAHLKNFASKYDDEIKSRMNKMIYEKLTKGFDSAKIPLFPEEIAYVMKHEDVENLIRNKKNAVFNTISKILNEIKEAKKNSSIVDKEEIKIKLLRLNHLAQSLHRDTASKFATIGNALIKFLICITIVGGPLALAINRALPENFMGRNRDRNIRKTFIYFKGKYQNAELDINEATHIANSMINN